MNESDFLTSECSWIKSVSQIESMSQIEPMVSLSKGLYHWYSPKLVLKYLNKKNFEIGELLLIAWHLYLYNRGVKNILLRSSKEVWDNTIQRKQDPKDLRKSNSELRGSDGGSIGPSVILWWKGKYRKGWKRRLR